MHVGALNNIGVNKLWRNMMLRCCREGWGRALAGQMP
jgi:hypothetical protein